MTSGEFRERGVRARVRRFLMSVVSGNEARVREIDEELRAHIEAHVDYLVARGVNPDTARAQAIQRFGDLDEGRAYLHAFARSQTRRAVLAERVSNWMQDVRYAARGLRRNPAFTAGVVTTFALGLGINLAVFRTADQVLFRAPPTVVDPNDVRRLGSSIAVGSASTVATSFSYNDVRALADAGAFTATAAYTPPRVAKRRDGQEVAVAYVDELFFPLLGVRAAAGRLFDASEAAVGAEVSVAVVSFEYWHRELGAARLDDRSTITLGDRTYQIIGVTPPKFFGIDLDPTDIWLPLGVGSFGRGNVNGVVIPWYKSEMFRGLRVIGRISRGTTDTAVVAKLSAALGTRDVDAGRIRRAVTMRKIVPMGDPTKVGETVRLLGRLTGVALIVLLIACSNAANLLLARGIRRRQEIAVRLATGASRWRIARLLGVETLMLGLAGGAAATLAAYWAATALRRLVLPDARWVSSAFDSRSLGLALLLTLAAVVAAGVAPAVQLSNPDLTGGLRESARRGGPRARSTRAALVVTQTAFSLILLVASGLLVRSLQRLNAVRLGFEPEGLVTVSLMQRFPEIGVAPKPLIDGVELAERLRRAPNVRGIALASSAPFGVTAVRDVMVPNSSYTPPSNFEAPRWAAVSDEYFTVMQTRVMRGRGFNRGDTRGSDPVAVVNRSMAANYWPGEIPPGSCLIVAGTCARVVGVVEDVRDSRGGGDAPMRFYLPLAQSNDSAGAVIVRTTPESASRLAREIMGLVPTERRPVVEVISDRVASALRPWRTAATLFLMLGSVALALACVGIYSVMSYIASERVHELGVRMVLGASGSEVIRLVFADGLRLAVIGGLVGLGAALAGARLLESLLFGISPYEPVIYVIGVACLVLAAAVATAVPAIRASRVEPMTALRSE